MSVALAKVGVASSSLVSRSRFKKPWSKDWGFFCYWFYYIFWKLFFFRYSIQLKMVGVLPDKAQLVWPVLLLDLAMIPAHK